MNGYDPLEHPRDAIGRFDHKNEGGFSGELGYEPETHDARAEEAWEAGLPVYDGNITNATLAQMLTDDAPLLARLAAARSGYPNVGAVAAHDRDPLVRAVAEASSPDLDEDTRSVIRHDPAVTRLLTFLTDGPTTTVPDPA